MNNVSFPKYDTYQLRAPGEGGGPPPGPCAAAQTHNILQQKGDEDGDDQDDDHGDDHGDSDSDDGQPRS